MNEISTRGCKGFARVSASRSIMCLGSISSGNFFEINFEFFSSLRNIIKTEYL